VVRRAGRPATFFEITTAMALVHFAEAAVDVAVVETGLGGRFDATNVLVPAVCAITPIALEHRRQLGRTLGAIAREKAGILKRGVPAVSAAQERAAREVLARRRRGRAARVLGRDVHARAVSEDLDYQGSRPAGRSRCGPRVPPGRQRCAGVAACERLSESGVLIGPEAMRRGVAAARWPGRLEIVRRDAGGRPRVVLDGAHNPAAARAIMDALPRAFSYRRLLLVSAAMADKDLGALTRALSREVLRTGGLVIATAPAFERAAAPRRLAEHFRRAGARTIARGSVPAAIDAALARARAGDLVLVAGRSIW
jgi:dihydrofolate synthase/folylpolyglutamate synthase